MVVEELDEGLKDDYGKLNEDLGRTSSLAIVKEGQLGKLGDIIYTLPFRYFLCPFLCEYSNWYADSKY